MKALEHLLFWASENYHPLYEKYLVEEYEEKHGPHFDERTARKAVESLSHFEHGERVSGEHWNISEVMDLTSSYVYSIGENDTYWDIYVALHVFWHNLGRVYSIRRIEQNLPYDAVVFFFLDDNIREGKIWYYMHQCAGIPGISRE